MDICHGETVRLEKFDIKVKSKPKDGLILQLHHTIRKSNGVNKRIRFSTGSFDDAHEKLACADNAGNIFILDFIDLKFWKVTNRCPSTALHFVPGKSNLLLIATDIKFTIDYVDIETGATGLSLSGHTAHIKHISFSNHKTECLLTASPVEAILWELKNYTKYFTLTTFASAQIQQIMFAPSSDYVVACFQNDTIQIWRQESMKSVKQILPNDLKHMKSIAFSTNGRAMAMAGLSSLLILFSMDTWKALKSIDLIRYDISGIHQLAFVPQMFDGGSNKVLAMLSSDCTLHFLDLERLTIVHCIHPETSGIRKFDISLTGKYFLCILQQGEVNIYNTSFVLDIAHSTQQEVKKSVELSQSVKKKSHKVKSKHKEEIENKTKTCMDSSRLRRILMQHGEYPEKYRATVWKKLLATPDNKKAYSLLLDKGIHPSYKDIEKQFTIHSTITLNSLKRLLSCLANWCPLFGVTDFLPAFVFPFVKVLQKDPLLLFECVATVLLNQCQLWFEYAPFPPISVLAMVENILAEHDQKLLDHYCHHGVTSQTYALSILETAFSEVLTCSEWLILWDHIVSNEPAFILMAVVAYNIVQRSAIKKLSNFEEIEKFFHMQNPIDKKTFLKKTYVLLKTTPDDIHPKQFLNSFVSLKNDSSYQQFNGYPKATICLKLAKKERNKLKDNKGKGYTLKELTTEKQEEQIRHRLQDDRASDSMSENCRDAEKQCESKTKKGTKKLVKPKLSSGDFDQKSIKNDLIDSIMFPKLQHITFDLEKTICPNRPDVKLNENLTFNRPDKLNKRNVTASYTKSDSSTS
ncbi:TBC1 domain family member 31 [Aricia agestis]|uniref:TBC1 domain family member 31 n=1 Tax=Aricia agestis TaxID=91739 RepID=UPI001C2086EA|nr:TBC1 domain family member 31 [Aricia agestis]